VPRRTPRIRALILDVDGVLTDGRLWYGPRGEVMKAFHVHDGHGLKALQRAGIAVAVISGRRSPAVTRRCRELGIRVVVQGAADKARALARVLTRLQVTAAQCACIGDDTPDVPVMRRVGLSFAVRNAHPDARAAANRVTRLDGGSGAVREVCDWLLRARGGAA
jgi:3-deoxy-D-manno-octulosonate 8-phosphate phosphatase (KDO 8-P phosphatase)